MNIPQDEQTELQREEQIKPQEIKVVFGWQAWILIMFIVGGLSNAIEKIGYSFYQRNTLSDQYVQDLEEEVYNLKNEIKTLNSKVQQLQQDTAQQQATAE